MNLRLIMTELLVAALAAPVAALYAEFGRWPLVEGGVGFQLS